jgi:hypothetical protein
LPPKSNSIIELEKTVAILEFRADATDTALEDTKKLRDEIKDQRDRLIKLEVKLEHMEKERGPWQVLGDQAGNHLGLDRQHVYDPDAASIEIPAGQVSR